MDQLAVALTYLGGAGALIGVLSIVRPLAFLRVRTRSAGAAVAGAGLLVIAGAWLIGGERRRAPGGRATRIDEFSPEYHFNEFHSIRVQAPPERVYAAVKAVTADEIRLFRMLTWIRSPSLARRAESILAPSRHTPILDIATRTTFALLADEPGREVVVGTPLGPPLGLGRPLRARDFVGLERSGYCKAAMNFLIEDEGGGWSRLSTETRVFANDEASRRKFALYWRVIYPGSALIRREWLKAIKRRAEAAALDGNV